MLKMWQLHTSLVQSIILANTYQRLALYTTSSCNLNCKYCYEKNYREGLQISHPQDYSIYINKLLELNPENKNTLTSIELWGGEPLLGLEEFIFYLSDFVKEFPNLQEIQFSTNLSLDNSVKLIHELYDQFIILQPKGKIKIQISIDGPITINDYNRQNGLTQTILNNVSKLNRSNLIITTNSNFTRKSLFSFIKYENIEEWFNFFLTNFPSNVKFGLFKMIKDIPPGARMTGTCWNETDGQRYAQLLQWADQWRELHPEESQRFIWPEFKLNKLKICAATAPNYMIALSPTGEQALCHRGVWEQQFLNEDNPIRNINLTDIYSYLMDYYNSYKDIITIDDFKESMLIYVNLNWCPYLWNFGPGSLEALWFSNEIPLLYNGAMNILLKWSKEYANS